MENKSKLMIVMFLILVLLQFGCNYDNEGININEVDDSLSNENQENNNNEIEDSSSNENQENNNNEIEDGSSNENQINNSNDKQLDESLEPEVKYGNSESDVIEGINRSGYEIVRRLNNKSEKKNILISPISLTTSLSMLVNGASGSTKDEILDVLNISDDENLNSTYDLLIERFEKISEKDERGEDYNTIINLANSLWFSLDTKIDADYMAMMKSNYHGDLFSVDFKDDKTKDEINKWISDKTNDLIKKAVEVINREATTYLINTLYFKGQWIDGFGEGNTKKSDFTLLTEEKVEVDMMSDRSKRYYDETEDAQIVALSFRSAVMYVVLPKDDITSFVKENDYDAINDMIENLETKNLVLYLPKFNYSAKYSLSGILKAFGMTSAFDPNVAEFDKMVSDGQKIFVSNASQSTQIELDETGVEAAAVTILTMRPTSVTLPVEEVTMRCDKPFLIIIKENMSDTYLFIGIVYNPTEN